MNSLRTSVLPLFALLVVTLAAAPAAALEKGRLLRMPDIQGDRIVFVYGGDLWTVARTGGMSVRLTSSDGQEGWPKFSPDGQTIAFTGEYDGNLDAYTIPLLGGEPNRLTTMAPRPTTYANNHTNALMILKSTYGAIGAWPSVSIKKAMISGMERSRTPRNRCTNGPLSMPARVATARPTANTKLVHAIT